MSRSKEFWSFFELMAPRLREWPTMARDETFRAMFEHLDSFDRAVKIVETGCIEDSDNWAGNGCSTILFAKYVETHPGSSAFSLEINLDKVEKALKICQPHVQFITGDSVASLRKMSTWAFKPVDLLYLDASHHDWVAETPSQAHHLAELMAAMPMLRPESLVAIDDSVTCFDDYPRNKVIGKGGLVAQYAMEIGAEMRFCRYQIGFVGMTSPPATAADIESLIGRARAFVEAGRADAADRIYHLILAMTPQPWTGKQRIARGEAAANFGRNAHQLRRWGTAIDWFEKALQADPHASDYRCELAISLVALGALDKAAREATIATEIDPDYPRNWQTLGGVESDRRNAQACIEAYDRQVETAEVCDPFVLSDALQNRAVIAMDTGDYGTVQKICARLLDIGARSGDALHLLAMMQNRLSNHEAAIGLFDEALSHGCRNKPLCHWNKSLSLEAIGRLKEAGVEKAWNEFEVTVPAIAIPQHRFAKPKWKGEGPLTDDRKTIVHVHHEAGFGDNIAMFRYFPELLDRGYEVHYETDPLLVDLVAANFPDVVVMPRTKDYPGVVGIQKFDYHIPVGDLPHAFGTDVDTIPWRGPYLKAAPDMERRLGEQVDRFATRSRIGLCWSAGIRRNTNIWMEQYGTMKSMCFNDVKPIIFGNPDRNFFSLQVGPERLQKTPAVIDLLSLEPTWDETAALIANLDLVITVDTAVAHLAGAMGKPVWIMMQRDGASWHFMCHRPGASWNEASPWYPSARLFRQHSFERREWDGAVADVAAALNELQ